MNDLSHDLERLILDQTAEWPQLREGIARLSDQKRTRIEGESFPLEIVLNPGRVRSVLADVSTAAISARPCFLCADARPKEQRGVDVSARLTAFANPFPLFADHFTVIAEEHVPQNLSPFLQETYSIINSLDESWALFFNGSQSGASAPDHFHLQLCRRTALPILSPLLVNRTSAFTPCSVIHTMNGFELVAHRADSESSFEMFFSSWHATHSFDRSNIVVVRDGRDVLTCSVPRRAHRPAAYYAEPPEKLLVSIATVELFGQIVTVRDEDYARLVSKPELVPHMLREVTVPL